MLTNITAFSKNGLSDWLVQRVSAVVIVAYLFCIIGFFWCYSGPITFEVWKDFMSLTGVRVFSLIAFMAIAAHAWIGLWTIATDYFKCTKIRLTFQLACLGALFVYLIWAVIILWS